MVAVKKSAKPIEAEDGEIFSASTFSSLGLHPNLCDQLQERLGFKAPTLVQAQAIPVILSGRHVLVNAATGTGKTVAYLAPVIHHLSLHQPRIQRSDGTFALVLVPTRELCLQVHEILQKLLHRFHWIVPGYVMGGENRDKEKARLRKGISILVATPGRLLDHLKNTSSFLHTNLRWIIFDEADRILELGFGKEIEEILEFLGSRKHGSAAKDSAVSSKFEFQRQNLLLSATLNEKVNHLAKMSLEKPVLIGMPDKKMQSITKFEPLGDSGSDSDEPQYSVKAIGSSNEDYKLPAQLTQRYVKGYTDADFASHYPDSGKSTSGYVFMLAGGAIAWKSVKQTLTTTSTMQAEFIAIYEGVCEGLWLKNFLIQTNVVDTIVSRPLKIYCDNSAAVCFTKNNKRSTNSKHIDLKYYTVRERVKNKELEVLKIATQAQLADPFTKALTVAAFTQHATDIGILPSLDA